jgi:hypothetical protein
MHDPHQPPEGTKPFAAVVGDNGITYDVHWTPWFICDACKRETTTGICGCPTPSTRYSRVQPMGFPQR